MSEEETEWYSVYKRTDPMEWSCLKAGAPGRHIDLVPYAGESEDFSIKIFDDKVKELMNKHGGIRSHKVLEWTMPRFFPDRDEIIFDWQAA